MTDFDDADPFVPIWEGPTFDGEYIRMRLEEAHVPVEFGDALLPGQARVQVPRSYLAEARDVLAGNKTSWPTVLTDDTADGLRMRMSLRVTLVLVAIVLVVVLVLSQW